MLDLHGGALAKRTPLLPTLSALKFEFISAAANEEQGSFSQFPLVI